MAKHKRPRLILYGERAERLKSFYAGRPVNLSNRVLLQLIEGMLRADALDESMALSLPIQEQVGDPSVFQFSLSKEKHPFLVDAYEHVGYGAKEHILSAYIHVAIGLWMTDDQQSQGAVKRYLKKAKGSVIEVEAEYDLPPAPMPDDERQDEGKIGSNPSEQATKPEAAQDQNAAGELDDVEDHSVFDDLDFDLDIDDEQAADIFRSV